MATLTQAIQAFIDETRTPDDEPIAFYDNADNPVSSSNTLTDASRFGLATFNGDHYLGHWLERPSVATAANLLRRISSIDTSTGIVTHDGANYSGDTAVLDYRVWRPEWHPRDYVVPLMNRALKEAWTWSREVLSIVPNAGGENSTVGGADFAGATTTRITTAASVLNGSASLQVANSGANGYHDYTEFDVAPSQPFKLYIWVRITTGSSAFISILDSTNVSPISVTTVTGRGEWQLVIITGSFPATCSRVKLEVGAASATGVTVWDAAALYWGDITLVEGPSWVTAWRDKDGGDAFRLLHAVPRVSTGSVSLTGTGGATAGPGRAYDLAVIDESRYQVLNMPAAANPVQFELDRQLWDQGAIFIEARRPWSHYNSTGSDTAITAETGTNAIPLRLWVKAAKKLYAEERGHPNLKLWTQQYNEEQRRVQSLLTTPTPGQAGLAWRRWR